MDGKGGFNPSLLELLAPMAMRISTTRKRGAKIIQINPGKTNFDRIAALNIRAGADEVFQKVIK